VSKPNTIYQLRIRLTDLQPPIWRRVQIEDCTLLRLHKIVQASMGWENRRVWRFEIDGKEYGDDVMDETYESDFISARKMKLSRLVEAGIERLCYAYDFEDEWVHTIDIEKTLQADPKVKYPRCIDGQRGCPPESCGGPVGYEKLLDGIADPEVVGGEEMLEWTDEFDSEAFDVDAVDQKLAKVR
jgi:hypothetical protein